MGATELWLVRHGESMANVAATSAELSGSETITVDHRDADVPLSALGQRQAHALGVWLRQHATAARPTEIWTSPYLRARQTIAIAVDEAALNQPVRVDERLRDRELGILDLLTTMGVERRLPTEAARQRWLGKFYYRPPGGESWCDVALRIRSFLRDVDADGGRLLMTAHDAVVLLFVYVCTGMDEAQLLDFALAHPVPNASVTRLVRPGGVGEWSLEQFADDEHLERASVPTTEHPGNTDVTVH